MAYKFFVRAAADKDAIEAAFGTVSYVEVPEIAGETAFVTEPMSGKYMKRLQQRSAV